MTISPYKTISGFLYNGFLIPEGEAGHEFQETYRKPNWSLTNPEAIEPLREFAKKCDLENQVIFQQIKDAYDAYVKQFTSLFHPHKKDDKKLLAALELVRPQANYSQLRKLDEYLKNVQIDHDRKQEQKNREVALELQKFEAVRKNAAALEFIKKNSQQHIVDYEKGEIRLISSIEAIADCVFHFNVAISIANDIRFEQLVTNWGDEVVDIDCCEECSTWTPGDRRCSCGNRRISWSYNGDFEDMSIYPEAY